MTGRFDDTSDEDLVELAGGLDYADGPDMGRPDKARAELTRRLIASLSGLREETHRSGTVMIWLTGAILVLTAVLVYLDVR